MRNVSDESCKENQNTHFVFNILFFNRAVCATRCRNIVETDSERKKIWRMLIAWCIPKATHTHTHTHTHNM